MHVGKAALDALDNRQFALDKIRYSFGRKVRFGAVRVPRKTAKSPLNLGGKSDRQSCARCHARSPDALVHKVTQFDAFRKCS
jgi:hypothetical protein